MDLRIFNALTLLIFSNYMSNNFAYKFDENLWKSSTPGELLDALDLLTLNDIKNQTLTIPIEKSTTPTTTTSKPLPHSDRVYVPETPTRRVAKDRYLDYSPMATTTTTSKPAPRRRAITSKSAQIKSTPPPAAKKRSFISEDNSAASTSAEADDYDRKYEQFVRNYFDDAADHYLSNDDENDSAVESGETSNLSGDISSESETASLEAVPYSSAKKSAKQTGKKCRKERRKREICVICKNLRNGERSETCSYERTGEPENYAYETQRKYRKTRDREDNSSGDDESEDNAESSEASEEEIAETKVEKNTAKPEKAIDITAPTSSCIKRIINGKSCYYCKDATGIEAIKCFALNPQKNFQGHKKSPLKINNNTHQKRRIYKRTLSYIYEKGLDSNETLTSPEELHANRTISLE